MKPFHHLLALRQFIENVESDLLDVNDNKAKILHDIKEARATCERLQKSISAEKEAAQQSQTMFCDTLTIEFSVNADFSDSYTRKYDAVCLDMETLKTIVYGERSLQNMSDEYLHARITIEDTDPEGA